jgi:hypothetical protein
VARLTGNSIIVRKADHRQCFCFLLLYSSVCYCLPVFEGFVVYNISIESDFGNWKAWETGSNVTIRFLDPHSCVSGLLIFLSISFRSKVIRDFCFDFILPWGCNFWGVLGDSRSLNACANQRDPEKVPTCFKPRRLRHHACWCDARFDQSAMKIIFKNGLSIQRKESHKVVIFHVNVVAASSNQLQLKFPHGFRSPI